MSIPVNKLKKSELEWMANHKCRHGHNYLSHFNCYLTEIKGQDERIGFFDIETTNLKANQGIMISYCIKDSNSDEILGRHLTNKELFSESMDKKLVQECVNDLLKFDRIVTYYGTGFDLPFIRTRAVLHGIDFPTYGGLIHTDVFYIIKSKFNLHRKSLEIACQTLLGTTRKTQLNGIRTLKACQGDKDEMEYIHTHCEYDVLDLEALYSKVINFKKHVNTSA